MNRNFQLFLSSHQFQLGHRDHRLVTRVLNGHSIGTYKAIDYEHLKLSASIKRSSGLQALQHVDKASKQSLENHKNKFLKQHQRIWRQELIRLQRSQKKLENEIEAVMASISSIACEPITAPSEDVIDLADELQGQFLNFKKSIVQPVNDLCKDLKFWIVHNKTLYESNPSSTNYKDVIEQIKFVKSQENCVYEQLRLEQQDLDIDLEINFDYSGPPEHAQDIHKEVDALECPDKKLKEDCLQEVSALDEKYKFSFSSLESDFADIRSESLEQWDVDDHLRFQAIAEQYAREPRNRRAMHLDRMAREFPSKQMDDIVAHESWWFRQRCYQTQKHDLIRAWQRDRSDTLLRIKATFLEALARWEAEENTLSQREHQRLLCDELHEKLKIYRQEKFEVMNLEAMERAANSKMEEEKRKEKDVIEKRRREAARLMLTEYKSKQSQRLAEEENANRTRLALLRENQELQRRKDEERVRYRQDVLAEKIEQRKRDLDAKLERAEETERRLQKLRDQVYVEAPSDKERLLRATEAVAHRTAARYDEEMDAQEPLFRTYTYNVEQIAADQRLKIETALRRADLIHGDYARLVISNVPPPSVPRRDHASTVFR